MKKIIINMDNMALHGFEMDESVFYNKLNSDHDFLTYTKTPIKEILVFKAHISSISVTEIK